MIKNANDMSNAQALIDSLKKDNVKRVKKDNSLIARESIKTDKVIINEDNRQVLLG